MTRHTQGRYWAATTAYSHPGADGSIETFVPSPDLIDNVISYVKGQREIGEGGYDHWQWFIYTKNRIRLNALKLKLPNWTHLELTTSNAYEDYVWKEDTRVPDTQFEYGEKTKKRKADDWTAIRKDAMAGNFEEIPDDIFVRHYNSLVRLRKDYAKPSQRPVIQVHVYWGVTGSGKTFKAFKDASEHPGDVYRKSSTTKWWDGYNGEPNIIIDEFDGHSIGITHLLQWLDPYPMSVEIKGAAIPLAGCNWWITSNINPLDWYPDANTEHRAALRRRLQNVHHFANTWEQIRNLEELFLGI